MNTAELIYHASQDLSENERLEVFGYINLIKARFGHKKQFEPETVLPQINKIDDIQISNDNSEQIFDILERIAKHRELSGTSIDIDEFEKSRQDRELIR